MISVEEFLNQKTNFILEQAVQEYLLKSKWSTLEIGSTREVDPSEYTLGTPREFIYKREFLEDCFSDNNNNWKNGSMQIILGIKEIDGSDIQRTTDEN